jgi:hypothetical protein
VTTPSWPRRPHPVLAPEDYQLWLAERRLAWIESQAERVYTLLRERGPLTAARTARLLTQRPGLTRDLLTHLEGQERVQRQDGRWRAVETVEAAS